MTSLAIEPLQWGKLADLHDVPPLQADDMECMKAIRSVLKQFGKLDRFALHLIHKHFDIADDEVLVEYSNAQTREQFFRPEKRDSADARDAVPTTWILKDIEASALCVCARTENGHMGRHAEG